MKCYLCGNETVGSVYSYSEPDKYLKAIGLTKNRRTWWYCPQCEFYTNANGLSEGQLEEAYLKYRNYEMRGATVREEFDRINALDLLESENKPRVEWLKNYLSIDSMLDIGSGLGIFPYHMKKYIKRIHCIEPEPESADFIKNELGFQCHQGFYETGLFPKVDLVTLVHVLEHIPQPVNFLRGIKEYDLKDNGLIFIEVPDACEFEYLDKHNDDFNSLHLWFFNLATLDRVLRNSGFVPFLAKRVYYESRKLSRIMMLCR